MPYLDYRQGTSNIHAKNEPVKGAEGGAEGRLTRRSLILLLY